MKKRRPDEIRKEILKLKEELAEVERIIPKMKKDNLDTPLDLHVDLKTSVSSLVEKILLEDVKLERLDKNYLDRLESVFRHAVYAFYGKTDFLEE